MATQMVDKYRNFAELAAAHREGVSYQVFAKIRNSAYVIMAPHGGVAEPHTSLIAEAVAGIHHSWYAFEALVRGLHVTSSNFDERRALDMAAAHQKVVAIHGCKNSRSRVVDVFVGGLDKPFRDGVIERLCRDGFRSDVDSHTRGNHRSNICNRGSSRSGIQLEIARRLRSQLTSRQGGEISKPLRDFAMAVRQAIKHHDAA